MIIVSAKQTAIIQIKYGLQVGIGRYMYK